MHRIIRRMGGAALALTLPLGLASCTKEPDALIAVGYENGKPVVLIPECARDEIWSLDVYRDEAPSVDRSGDYMHWSIESIAVAASPGEDTRTENVAPARITLFEAPPGWRVKEKILRQPALREEFAYQVSPSGNTYDVDFTLAELRGLPSGQVLFARRYGGTTAVSEKEWQDTAAEDCDD